MRIAIVGSGVSGLVAADLLCPHHDVVLFEADARLGGHTHTVEVARPDGTPLGIDTGFIVFNTRTYPNFVAWLGQLGVASQHSDMSFSVRSDARDFEYSSAGLDGLFAQRRHLASPRFHRMWRDILRFYRESRELLEPGCELRLADYLERRGYSEAFVTDHLLPLAGAVWSSNREGIRDFPARLLVRFFDHHGFLRRGDGLPWLTIPGGSREYITAMLSRFRGEVRPRCPIARIRRAHGGVYLTTPDHPAERFDHVVVASHADQALAMLEAPTHDERELLAAFPFQRNDAVLHTDEQLMPRSRRAWASWNYHLDDAGSGGGACVTYWMNRLQSIPGDTQYFVTLNRASAVRTDRILGRFTYTHPFFTPAAAAAQARHDTLIGHRGLSYCGAYWRNGFHEDGVVSALRVCERLGATLDRRPHARRQVTLAASSAAAPVALTSGSASAPALASAIYEGRLTHARRGPRHHRFSYQLHMLYLDLDETEPIGRLTPLFRRGRFGALSFAREDYLGDPSRPLKDEVLDLVAERLGRRPDGPVRLLTQVRWFGYVFNPVSFYYCFAADGVTLQAIVAEITNTPWQERHRYVLPAGDGAVRAAFPKSFHVSPFFAMSQQYRWLLPVPGERLVVTMVNEEGGREVFSATLSMVRRPLTARSLSTLVIRQPLMSWRVHLGIYAQAFRLWLKRTPYFEHPARQTPVIRREETWKT